MQNYTCNLAYVVRTNQHLINQLTSHVNTVQIKLENYFNTFTEQHDKAENGYQVMHECKTHVYKVNRL